MLLVAEILCISYLLVVCVFLTFLFGAVGSVHGYACFFLFVELWKEGEIFWQKLGKGSYNIFRVHFMPLVSCAY